MTTAPAGSREKDTTMSTDDDTKTKKAFDFARNSTYVADPMDICIIGGKVLPLDEQGPLDTDDGPEHDLYDERLTTVVITDAEVANVDTYGVLQDITITKCPKTGNALAVDGRGRIRRARRVNLLRAKRGEPPIKIGCKVQRAKGYRLMGAMIAANEVRNDDGPMVKLEKAKRFMERGVSPGDAAIAFGMTEDWLNKLLAFEDNAAPEVLAAVSSGEMHATAGVHLVKAAKDSETQRKALAGARSKAAATGRKITTKDATEAAKVATGKASTDTGAGLVPTRRELAALVKLVGANTEPAAEARVLIDDEKDESGLEVTQAHVVDAYFIGVEAALALVLGKSDDKTLLGMLAKARRSVAG